MCFASIRIFLFALLCSPFLHHHTTNLVKRLFETTNTMRVNHLLYQMAFLFIFETVSVHSAAAQTQSTNPVAETSICTGDAEKGARKHKADTIRTEFFQKVSIPYHYGLFHTEYFRSADFYESDYLADINERHKFYDGFELPQEWQKKLGSRSQIIGVVDMLLNPVQKGITPKYYGDDFSDYGYVVRSESGDTSGHYTVLFLIFQGYVEQKGPQYELQELNRAVRREIAAMGETTNVLLSYIDSSTVMIEASAPGPKGSDIETEVKKYTFSRSKKGKWLLEKISELIIKKVEEGKLYVDSLDYTVKSSQKISLFGNDDEIRKVLCSKETYIIIKRAFKISKPPQGMIPQLGPDDSLSYFLPLITSSNSLKNYIYIIDYNKRSEDAMRKMYMVCQNEKSVWDVKFQMELSFLAPFGGEPIHSFSIGEGWFDITFEFGMRWKSNVCSHFKYDPSMRKWNIFGESSSEESYDGGVQSLGLRCSVEEYHN